MLKNRSVTPAPGGPFDPESLREQGPEEPRLVAPDDDPSSDGDGDERHEAPDRDADEGMSRVEDAADGDDAGGDDPDGVADPPTGDDPGPGPDGDDPMGGAAPSG